MSLKQKEKKVLTSGEVSRQPDQHLGAHGVVSVQPGHQQDVGSVLVVQKACS